MDSRDQIAHLLRRATFGPTAAEIDAAQRRGYEATVEALVNPASPIPVTWPALAPDPYAAIGPGSSREQRQAARKAQREQVRQLTGWWLGRLALESGTPFVEKLVFFWHGHWATSARKVNSAHLMLAQQRVFRDHGRGEFGVMVKAMLRDAALILWLDGQRNTRKAPNENLARELMELFTLGIGNYTEEDVKAAARALTGWSIDRSTGLTRLEQARFDPGEKTILGQTATFTADGLADLLMAQPAAAKFLAARLWFRFGSGESTPAFTPSLDISATAKAMFLHPSFLESRGQLVKQPVEFLIGAMRQLGIDPGALSEKEQQTFAGALNALDQVPLLPPSVAGWPAGPAWLTTYSAQTRLRTAEGLAAKAAVLDRIEAAPAQGRPDAIARLLAVDAWTERTRDLLLAAKQPQRMLALALASPEYAVQ
jgi:uncharacterized protein (DUF1800 family)